MNPKPGDLFINNYRSFTKPGELISNVMYISEDEYLYTEGGNVYTANFFDNLDKNRLRHIRSFNIDNMTEAERDNIVLSAQNIDRENKINLIID